MLIMPPILIEKSPNYRESYGVLMPIGLGYIASLLEDDGYDVCILDAIVEGYEHFVHEHDEFLRMGLDWDDIISRILDFGPHVIGISSMFTKNYQTTYSLAKIIKEKIDKNIIIVTGGVHATVMPQHIMENSPVDFILKGEAEYSFLELLYQIKNDRNFSLVDGLIYYKNGKITENSKTNYIDNLDKLPFPAYKRLNLEKYQSINMPYGQLEEDRPKQSPSFPMMTSRSCKARCCFCETWKIMGPKVRLRSADNILSEIQLLVEKYGCKELLILDDNILYDKDRAKKIFDSMSTDFPHLTWKPMNGISLWSMNEELMYKMRQSGCYEITMAIESGNKRVLKEIIHKPLDLDAVPKLANLAKNLGFKTTALFVIGFPGETKREIQDTINFAESLDVDKVVFSIATPFPGTELFEICKENNYLVDFNLERLRFGQASIETPHFSRDYLKKVRKDEWVRINYTRKGLKPPN